MLNLRVTANAGPTTDSARPDRGGPFGGLRRSLALPMFVGTALVAADLPPDLLVVGWWSSSAAGRRGRAGGLRAGRGSCGGPAGVRRPAGPRRRRDRGALDRRRGRGRPPPCAASPCVVLRLRDGRTTTIPVGVLAVDRERFVRDPGALQRARTTPLGSTPDRTDSPPPARACSLSDAVREASPSPVYGARLLSGFGGQPPRGFKSRRLRQPSGPLSPSRESREDRLTLRSGQLQGYALQLVSQPWAALDPSAPTDLRFGGWDSTSTTASRET